MKIRLKFALTIALTAIATFSVTAHFAKRTSWTAFVAATYDMEAFNELHRIKSWDRLEQLLIRGCNKEALEYVRMEQSIGLGALKWHLDNGARLENKIADENRSVVNRAKSFTGKNKYDVPTCN